MLGTVRAEYRYDDDLLACYHVDAGGATAERGELSSLLFGYLSERV